MKILRSAVALLALCCAMPALAAKCTVTEFVALPVDSHEHILYLGVLSSSTVSQAVTFSTSTKTTNALQSTTNFIRVYCDSEAHVAVGDSSVTATAASPGLPAGGWEYFSVTTSASDRYVAIYDGSS